MANQTIAPQKEYVTLEDFIDGQNNFICTFWMIVIQVIGGELLLTLKGFKNKIEKWNER